MGLREHFDSVGGVSSTSGLAAFLDIAEPVVRWGAAENNVPKVGNAYAWSYDAAEAFATALGLDTGDDEDGVDPDEEDEEDDPDADDQDSWDPEDEDEDE